jgi:hypothetical protein
MIEKEIIENWRIVLHTFEPMTLEAIGEIFINKGKN